MRDSSPTNEVTIKTPIHGGSFQLVAEAVNSTTIKLKWQDNSNNEYDFTVEKAKVQIHYDKSDTGQQYAYTDLLASQ